MQYIGLGRSHERKPREMFCFESYLKIKVLAKSNVLLIRINTYINSLEIIGLCLMKHFKICHIFGIQKPT